MCLLGLPQWSISLQEQTETKRLKARDMAHNKEHCRAEIEVHKALQGQKEAVELSLIPSELYEELMVIDASLKGLSLSTHAPTHSSGHTRPANKVVLSAVVFAFGISRS